MKSLPQTVRLTIRLIQIWANSFATQTQSAVFKRLRQALALENFNDTLFFTKLRADCCKCLIEHLKLYLSFTIFIFAGGKVRAEEEHGRRSATALTGAISELVEFIHQR